MKRKTIIYLTGIILFAIIIFFKITIFVIQPIGAIPEGKTLVILQNQNTKFIDSADSFCQRNQGGVNLICRAAIIGAVGEKSTILMRLPYSEILYKVSTNGTTYEK